MGTEWQRRLSSVNDARLAPLIEAADDAAGAEAMETILVEARPMIRRVLGQARTDRADHDDIESTVSLRLFRRLDLARLYEEQAIRSLDEFIATLTYNAIHDLLRRRFPERSRLKSRLRYLFTHDKRFALWHGDAGMVCGLADWRDRPLGSHAITTENASPAMCRRHAPADALMAVFARAAAPLPLEDVVDLAALLWDIVDAERPVVEAVAEERPFDHVEARQYLTVLWNEIGQLREPQRVALLLSMRNDDGTSPLAHLVLGGIATMEDIAGAIGIPLEQLAKLWDELPVADSVIAGMVGLTRQQVINLRKSARERLARRMRP